MLKQIPLVDHQHHAPPLADHLLQNLLVLAGQPLVGADHHKDHVAAANGPVRADGAVELQGLAHPGAPPQPGCVDQNQILATVHHARVDAVPGGARDLGDNQLVLTEHCVHKAGLAHVGPSNHRHSDRLVRLRLFSLLLGKFRQALGNSVQQVAGGPTFGGRDPERLPKTQGVELVHSRFLGGAVDLVGHQ